MSTMMSSAPPDTLSSTTVLSLCPGLTYRMLDYWGRTKVLVPGAVAAHGSGSRRAYTADQVPALRVLGRMAAAFGAVGAGVPHEFVGRIYDAVRAGSTSIELAEGITLHWETEDLNITRS